MSDVNQRFAAIQPVIAQTPCERLEVTLAAVPHGIEGVLDTLFELLVSEFNPDKAEGGRGVFQFDITGAADTWHYQLEVGDDGCRFARGAVDGPDVTVAIGVENMVLMGAGRLPGVTAWAEGKLELTGDPMVAARLGSWFDHPEE